MEAITHNLIGILAQILCFIYLIFPFNFIFTIIFAFLSHFLIDTLAKMTYHTPEPHKEDKFWVAWHIITPALILVLIIWILIINWILFFFFILGAVFANLVDILDWQIIRPIQAKKKKLTPESKWHEKGFFHPIIDWLREKPFFWLPNWNYEKKGVIVEILTIVILWALIIYFLPYLTF